jgi:hypothetical protein
VLFVVSECFPLADTSFTKNIKIITATTPGSKETMNILRISISGRRAKAAIGPTIAPVWSIVLCIPKALPEIDSETESVIRASRGAVLIPFPILSVALMTKASSQLVLVAKKGLITVDIPYPIRTNIFLFPSLSEREPENSLKA